MTPDEHYREAERLLETAIKALDMTTGWAQDKSLNNATIEAGLERSDFLVNLCVARAQVHATLATISHQNFMDK